MKAQRLRRNEVAFTSQTVREFGTEFDVYGYYVYDVGRGDNMTKTTRVSSMRIKVNPDIKTKAKPILKAIGLSFSDVFNLTLNQICLKRKLPFEITAEQLTENGYTREFEESILKEAQELYEAVENGTAKIYNSAAELFADLDEEDDEYD